MKQPKFKPGQLVRYVYEDNNSDWNNYHSVPGAGALSALDREIVRAGALWVGIILDYNPAPSNFKAHAGYKVYWFNVGKTGNSYYSDSALKAYEKI